MYTHTCTYILNQFRCVTYNLGWCVLHTVCCGRGDRFLDLGDPLRHQRLDRRLDSPTCFQTPLLLAPDHWTGKQGDRQDFPGSDLPGNGSGVPVLARTVLHKCLGVVQGIDCHAGGDMKVASCYKKNIVTLNERTK